MQTDQPTVRNIIFSKTRLSIEDIGAIATRSASVTLSDDRDFRAAITRGADFLDRLLREDGIIYGVTTGYGDSCTVVVPPDLISELPHHLYAYHGCGLGDYFDAPQVRAILATRLASLCKGYSGVSIGLLQQITALLQHDLLPLMPSEGSVGASGDLTPLSYLAAVLCGEREVWRSDQSEQGLAPQRVAAAAALAAAGLQPLRLRPKEGLAIMNGTAVMTALACLAFQRAAYLMQLATRITAMASFALDGNAHHFDETLFSVKPHVGQQQVAAWLRSDLDCRQQQRNDQRLQDRYSIRCAPHVIGVLADALPWMREAIENELNSANDNPIIDAENERVLHGGHFYGGHIAFAMDSLKNAVANIADLLDRQMALLVDTRYNNGLPSNLSASSGPRAAINHGLKALQISSSAWTAEALKLTMPASVFSRSTECHNQDKVSMGTIAARDCLRVLTLTEQVVAALLISVRQGVALRVGLQEKMVSGTAAASASPTLAALPGGRLVQMLDALATDIALVEEDRMLEPDLRRLIANIQSRHWNLYEA
jgi:histidine ammonia-lyase